MARPGSQQRLSPREVADGARVSLRTIYRHKDKLRAVTRPDGGVDVPRAAYERYRASRGNYLAPGNRISRQAAARAFGVSERQFDRLARRADYPRCDINGYTWYCRRTIRRDAKRRRYALTFAHRFREWEARRRTARRVAHRSQAAALPTTTIGRAVFEGVYLPTNAVAEMIRPRLPRREVYRRTHGRSRLRLCTALKYVGDADMLKALVTKVARFVATKEINSKASWRFSRWLLRKPTTSRDKEVRRVLRHAQTGTATAAQPNGNREAIKRRAVDIMRWCARRRLI
jgi:hypothetical protein